MLTIDLSKTELRELNEGLYAQMDAVTETDWEVLNPRGHHAVAVGINAAINVDVHGSVGYYCAGMHQKGSVIVEGNVGVGCAEKPTKHTQHKVSPERCEVTVV